jgi:hypothetical protein
MGTPPERWQPVPDLWHGLPSRLTSLSVKHYMLGSPLTLGLLPSCLKMLGIQFNEDPSEHDAPEEVEPQTKKKSQSPWFIHAAAFSKSLPVGLCHLNLYLRPTHFGFPWPVWLQDMRHLSQLRVLDVLTTVLDVVPMEVTLDQLPSPLPLPNAPHEFSFLSCLPQSLRFLKIPILGDFASHPSCLSNLPSNLAELHLAGPHHIKCQDEHFSHLPHSLVRLLLLPDTQAEGLTDSLINVLPPHLNELRMPVTMNHLPGQYLSTRPNWIELLHAANMR